MIASSPGLRRAASRLGLLALFALAVSCAPKTVEPTPVTEENSASLRAPSADHFVFGPGDVFELTAWRAPELDSQLTVAPDGAVMVPLVGRVDVEGLTYNELVRTLTRELAAYYTEPQIAVNIVEVSNQKVFILGEVNNPSVLQAKSQLNILEALTLTGGINEDARTDNVLLIRGGLDEPELFLVDVRAIYKQGDLSQMIMLQRGDIVVVPAKTIVNVERFFRRIQSMLAPFVAGSAVYRNIVSGGAQGTSSVLIE